MKVLVCGGRNFDKATLLFSTLEKLGVTHLIHGGASGADALAHEWAVANNVPVTPFPADWNRFFKAAGPLRNRQMLVEGKPDLVVAFAGGRGTADMIRQAEAAGVQVVKVGDDV
jgi:hypothetical protein